MSIGVSPAIRSTEKGEGGVIVPRPLKFYANVYPSLNGARGSLWDSKELADWFGRGRLACVEIAFDGEGGAVVSVVKGKRENEQDWNSLRLCDGDH